MSDHNKQFVLHSHERRTCPDAALSMHRLLLNVHLCILESKCYLAKIAILLCRYLTSDFGGRDCTLLPPSPPFSMLRRDGDEHEIFHERPLALVINIDLGGWMGGGRAGDLNLSIDKS